MLLIEHLTFKCDLIGKILEAERNFTLTADPNKVINQSLELTVTYLQ